MSGKMSDIQWYTTEPLGWMVVSWKGNSVKGRNEGMAKMVGRDGGGGRERTKQ